MDLPSTQRMYRRISAEYPGCYLTCHAMQQAVVRDISLNGFRVEGQSGLPYGAIVKIQLWLPNGEGRVDIDQAMVRWKTEREFGLQIVSIANESDLRLARHVEHRLQQAAFDMAC